MYFSSSWALNSRCLGVTCISHGDPGGAWWAALAEGMAEGFRCRTGGGGSSFREPEMELSGKKTAGSLPPIGILSRSMEGRGKGCCGWKTAQTISSKSQEPLVAWSIQESFTKDVWEWISCDQAFWRTFGEDLTSTIIAAGLRASFKEVKGGEKGPLSIWNFVLENGSHNI